MLWKMLEKIIPANKADESDDDYDEEAFEKA